MIMSRFIVNVNCFEDDDSPIGPQDYYERYKAHVMFIFNIN